MRPARLAGVGRSHHQQALETVGPQHEVGHHQAVAAWAAIGRRGGIGRGVAQHRGHHAVVAKPAPRLGQQSLWLLKLTRHHGQRQGRDGAARQRRQPAFGHVQPGQQFGLRITQGHAFWQGLHQHITRELGVTLPLQRTLVGPQAQPQEVALQVGRRQARVAGQALQVAALGGAVHTFVQQRHRQHQRRAAYARRGSGMHLVVQVGAFRVVGRQQAAAGRCAFVG